MSKKVASSRGTLPADAVSSETVALLLQEQTETPQPPTKQQQQQQSTTPPPTTMKTTKNCFEGIVLTDELHSLLQRAIESLSTFPLPYETKENDDRKDDETKKIHFDTNRKHNINTGTDIALLFNQMTLLSQTTHLSTLREALSILRQQQQQRPAATTKPYHISIATLRAMETIFHYIDATQNSDSDSNTLSDNNDTTTSSSSTTTSLSSELQHALRRRQQQQPIEIAYTTSILQNETTTSSKVQKLTREQMKFQQRMVKLRLQQEERRYMKLTNNVGVGTYNNKNNDDNITTKSMTYAASIGLNMIVAPISFGVFMYFFAGSLLDYFYPPTLSSSHHSTNAATVDIKKVMVGVVSGVIMLFIEMILFVIRTHELDKAVTMKRKKQNLTSNTLSPFGYYKSTTTKTYVDR